MPIIARLIFQAVHWAARKGLRDGDAPSPEAKKHRARQTGIRGETYAYWYLRGHGYVFVARNFTPRASKGEIDMVGYDGKTLAFRRGTHAHGTRRNVCFTGVERHAW